jgi:hypothetical protein
VWPDSHITINSYPSISGLDGTATRTGHLKAIRARAADTQAQRPA